MSYIRERLCLQCSKELNKNKNKFCCNSCAATYNNLHRIKTTKGLTKQFTCQQCNSIFTDSIHRSKNNILCPECKHENKEKQTKSKKICRICGSVDCQNEFCKHPAGRIVQIQGLIKNFGFDSNKLGTSEVFDEYSRIKKELYDLYINQQKSSIEIANIYGYRYNIFQILYSLGIPTRKQHEANILSILHGRNTPVDHIHFNAQWYTTWNNKEVYLRSSYEVDYAKELDKQKIEYEVESLRIKYFDTQQNEYRCAIPDFYLPISNTIIEVKSDYTLDVQNMKDKVKVYRALGYKFKLILEHKEVDLDLF